MLIADRVRRSIAFAARVSIRAVDLICVLLAVLAGIYLVAIMFGIVISAVARTFDLSRVIGEMTGITAPWFVSGAWASHIFTFAEFGMLYIAMAASPWLVRERGHVFIELLTAVLPGRLQGPFSRFVSALSAIVCLVLVWYTWIATAKAYSYGDAEMRSLDMPKFLLLGAMPICFALMAAQFSRFVFGPETLHTGKAGVHE